MTTAASPDLARALAEQTTLTLAAYPALYVDLEEALESQDETGTAASRTGACLMASALVMLIRAARDVETPDDDLALLLSMARLVADDVLLAAGCQTTSQLRGSKILRPDEALVLAAEAGLDLSEASNGCGDGR